MLLPLYVPLGTPLWCRGHGLEVVTVHDRPRKTVLGSYTYLIECTGGGYDAFEAVMRENETFEFRYLGSFPVR